MSYLAYTGIGSRSTPSHILDIMRNLGAHLASEGWTLRSGGAHGADTAFEVGVDDYLQVIPNKGGGHYQQYKEIYLPWAGFNDHPSNLHPRNIPFSDHEQEFASSHHPAWNRCSPSAKLLHTRNVRQLLGHQSICGDQVQMSRFVICWTPGGRLEGGTAQALRIANALNIPIFNLGSNWTFQTLEDQVNAIQNLQRRIKLRNQ